jgi:carbon-monoxide dehydrogenase small subunit
MPDTNISVTITVNGKSHTRSIDPRMLLVEFIREELDLTGTHIGCDTSYCGACTVLLNGAAVKSCTVFAFHADGGDVLTVEGLEKDGQLSALQKAYGDNYGLQCGYCTPGFLMSTTQLLAEHPHPTDKEISKAIAGNTCRCTGYQNIFKAIQAAAQSGKGA